MGWPILLFGTAKKSKTMHLYRCYGLQVESEVEIPEFTPSDHGVTDVKIRYGNVSKPEGKREEGGFLTVQSGSEATTVWAEHAGGIEARHGRELVISPLEGAEENGFRFFVSGIGMSLILYQRNISSLHASAVVVEDEAVAFVGGKGMGKSTTAAAFHKEGHPVVTDDVLPYRAKTEPVDVIPAFPHLKLFSDSVEAVFDEDPDSHPRLDPRGDKRTRSVEPGFRAESLPLRCVYVLEWKKQGSIKTSEITGQEACMELLRNSFAFRLLKTEKAVPDALTQVAQIANQVPIRRLIRPRNLDEVHKIPSFIGYDLRRPERGSFCEEETPSENSSR